MRIGYVFIPFLPIAVERGRNPELADKQVIVGGYPYERKPVFAASAECVEAGVKVGMPLRQAYMLCPEAVFLTTDFEAYKSGYEDFLVALDSFSPTVERDDLGAAYIDAEGLTLLFGEERELGRRIVEAIRRHLGMSARVAFGSGKFVVRVAARLAPDGGVTVVAKGESATFLRDLSVDWLGLGEFSGERLRMLGIKTIGQFMRLPAQSLMEQFGPDAAAARRAVDGEGKDVAVPRPEPLFLERSVSLDYPILSMEGFSSLARDLIAFLVAQLRHRGLACQTVTLQIELENGRNEEASTQLKEPTDSEGDLLFDLEKLVSRMNSSRKDKLGDKPRPSPVGKDPSSGRTLHLEGGGAVRSFPGRTSDLYERTLALHGRKGPVDDAGIVSMRVTLGGLVPPVSRQMGLFDAQRRRRVYLDKALDEIRERFGERVQVGITSSQTTTRTTRARAAHLEG